MRSAVVMLAVCAWCATVACALEPLEFTDAIRREASGWNAAQFRVKVDAYGESVVAARDQRTGVAGLSSLRAAGDALHAACRARIRALEAARGEDEAALEALYRSEDWHDMNYALAGVRNWQAWLDLAVAGATADADQRIRALSAAERGFQATALRLLFPGLVYGSWLGMAYVELARGEDTAAENRLARLQTALAADPDNPLAEIVATELAVIRARRGELSAALPPADESITPSVARRLVEEAFAILAERRERGVLASEAAERLRRVIEGGYLDDALMVRMLEYRDEIVGRDVGVVGLLLDAEYAYAHGQYETTVLKYREFERGDGYRFGFDAAPFRYHHAAALYQLGYLREAWERAGELVQHPEVGAMARKLRFLAAERLQRQEPGEAASARVVQAARAYLAGDPDDPDVALAHLALASAGPSSESASHLEAARRDPRMRVAAARATLERELVAFASAKDARGRAETARGVLAALGSLPARERGTAPVRALGLQMRIASGEHGADALAAIDALRAEVGTDPTLQRVLVWSELHAATGTELVRRVTRIAASVDGTQRQELVAFLLELEQTGENVLLASLLDAVSGGFADQPDMRRRLLLMRVRVLERGGHVQEGFSVAQALVRDFPDSGDAWQAYARTASAVGDDLAAERGWARIAASVPRGSDHWIAATLSRTGVLTRRDGADPGHCRLLQEASRYRGRMAKAERDRLDALGRENRCALIAGG